MKRHFLVCIFLLASVLLMAQKPIAKFTAESHDFGTIKEEKGKVMNTFVFTNVGNSDLLLTEVKASCGCTTPKWSKKPIPPGGKGLISVIYNPKNRPGPFNKTITVSNNSDQPKIQLIIKGDVIPDPTKKPAKEKTKETK